MNFPQSYIKILSRYINYLIKYFNITQQNNIKIIKLGTENNTIVYSITIISNNDISELSKNLLHYEDSLKNKLMDIYFQLEGTAPSNINTYTNIKNFYIDKINYYSNQVEIIISVEYTERSKINNLFETVLNIEEIVCAYDADTIPIDIAKKLGVSIEGTIDQVKIRVNNYLNSRGNVNIMKYLEDARKVKSELNLNKGPWSCLPSDLFLLSFVSDPKYLPSKLRNYITDKYMGHDDYELFEFLGDSVLELIVRNKLMVGNPNASPGQLSRYSSLAVRNSSLNCLMNSKGLCYNIVASPKIKSLALESKDKKYIKICADVFEAMLGILYHYLYNIEKDESAITKITKWLEEEWNINDIIKDIQEGKDVCSR